MIKKYVIANPVRMQSLLIYLQYPLSKNVAPIVEVDSELLWYSYFISFISALTSPVAEKIAFAGPKLVTAAHSTDAIKASGTALVQNALTKASGPIVSAHTNPSIFVGVYRWSDSDLDFCFFGEVGPFCYHPLISCVKLRACVGAFGKWYWLGLRSCDYYSCCARTHSGHEILSSTWCVS